MGGVFYSCLLCFAPDLIWSLPFLTEKKRLQFHKEHQLDRTKLRLYISNNNNNVWDFFIMSYFILILQVFQPLPHGMYYRFVAFVL